MREYFEFVSTFVIIMPLQTWKGICIVRRLNCILPVIGIFYALILVSAPALADGDPEKGKKEFRKCSTCHALEEGKKKIGPTLFKILGRTAGEVDGFKYSQSYLDAGKKGLKWDKENLIAYLENPKEFLKQYLGEEKVKTKMLLKIKKIDAREDIVAYLETLN